MGYPQKSVKGSLPKSFIFHIDAKCEGINCSDEDDIHEWVSDKLLGEIDFCHFTNSIIAMYYAINNIKNGFINPKHSKVKNEHQLL